MIHCAAWLRRAERHRRRGIAPLPFLSPKMKKSHDLGIIQAVGKYVVSSIHEMCQGMEISLPEFFNSSLFAENNLDP